MDADPLPFPCGPPTDGERRRRDTGRARRQTPTAEGGEAGAGRSNTRGRPTSAKRVGAAAAAAAEEERGNEVAGAVALGEEEGGPAGEGGTSADGSAYNPENPYHVRNGSPTLHR